MIAATALPNGLRIVTETLPHVRSAAIGIWADVGSACEPAAQRGVSHLVEHMLFKGTTRRTAADIAREMDALGGNLNAFTDKETTCYYAHVMDRHVPQAIDLLGDMFCRSVFDPRELEREQNVVLDEIRMYDDSPDDVLHEAFVRTMWDGSPLCEPTIGYAAAVSALTPDDLRAWMAQRYTPATVVVTAAGRIAHREIVALVSTAFGGFAGAAPAPAPERPHAAPGVHVVPRPTEQVYLMLGTGGLSLAHEDRYALSVLDTIVGGGTSSRLFTEIRERRGLAYSISSFEHAFRAAGLFGVYAATAPEHVQACIDVIGEVLDSVAGQIDAADVDLAREHLKGGMALALESTPSRMMRLGRNELVYGRDVPLEELEARLDAVDVAAVARVGRKLLAAERRGLCVVGPLERGDIRFDVAAA